MENYSKILKCSKVPLIIAIIFAVIGALGISYSSRSQENKQQEYISKDYRELISNEQDVENEYVEVTITYMPYIFMKEEYDDFAVNYYFVIDQDNYPYIVRLTDSTYTMLESKYNENPEEFSYTLKGYIFDYSKEMKEFAIVAYNQATQKELVNNDNFKTYFGNTYLDEIQIPFYVSDILAIVGGVLGIAISPILLIIYIISVIKTRRTFKKYDKEDLEYELSKTSTIEYKKAKVYLTDKYIISKIRGITVIEYNELINIYNEKGRINGIPTVMCLKGRTNKKTYDLAEVFFSFEKGEKVLFEIMNKIQGKNPQVTIGHTLNTSTKL